MSKIICKSGEVVYSYEDYLKTNHWQELRYKCIEKAGGLCQACAKRRPLQIHHLHYKTLGNEDFSDLKPLCDTCHKKEHGIEVHCNGKKVSDKARDRGRRTLKRMKDNRDRIIEIFKTSDAPRNDLIKEFSKAFARKVMRSPMFKEYNREYKERKIKKIYKTVKK